jgi:hypothetical protein
MRLVYCIDEGLSRAKDYGQRTWGDGVNVDSPLLFHAPRYYSGVVAGEFPFKTFDGVVDVIDDEYDDVYVSVVDAKGDEREFTAEGDISLYATGKRMVVRYAEVAELNPADPVICVMEMWIEDAMRKSDD